jgi:hypothetical protein
MVAKMDGSEVLASRCLDVGTTIINENDVFGFCAEGRYEPLVDTRIGLS